MKREISEKQVLATIESGQVLEDDLFLEYPAEILLEIAKIVVVPCTYQIQLERIVYNIYQLVKTIVLFVRNPFIFFLEPLKSVRVPCQSFIKSILSFVSKRYFRKGNLHYQRGIL